LHDDWARLPDRDEVCWAEGVFARSAGQAPLTRPEVYARETVLMKDWNPRAEFVVQDLRVGEVGIAALPCEVFAETGLAIKEHSRQRPSSTIELANGQSGYLPTPAQHKLGGYETWRARSSFLEAEPKPKLRSKALELLGEPAPKKGRG
jgi:neutral ceramidase